MSKTITNNFRSYQQMDDIYKDLYKKGLVNEPYIVKKFNDNQLLVFIGARHSNDINDSQNRVIKNEWNSFIANPNKSKISFCEGGLRPLDKSKDDAIRKYSEPGLLTWLSNKDNVPMISPEPDETKEINYLKENSFSVAEIMTYYFGRQMYQWIKRDYLNYKDWEVYANRHISSYAQLKPFQSNDLTMEIVLNMFKETTNHKFSLNNERLLFKIGDPTSNPVSSASGVFRDISLFKAIEKAWGEGKDIFSLYGSGHAIILENAIKAL